MNLFFIKTQKIKKWTIAAWLFLLLAGGILPLAVDPVRGLVFNEARALEWQWPAVPGVGTLEQNSDEAIIERCQQATPSGDKEKIAKCVQQEKNEQLGYILKYFLYLFFFIAGGVILILIITAGIGYIDASGKVDKMMRSKERLNRALLGLVILISSWALLYLINPNLLIFKAKVPPILTNPSIAAEPIAAKATMLTFSPKEAIEAALDKMMLKDPVTGVLDVVKPFDDSAIVLKEALALLKGTEPVSSQPTTPGTPGGDFSGGGGGGGGAGRGFVFDDPSRPGLQELLQKCKCGKSKSHIERIGTLNFVVAGGINPEDVKARFEQITKNEIGPDGKPGRDINMQDICLTRCDDCGTDTEHSYDCMLYDVFVKPSLADPTKKEVWIDVPPVGKTGDLLLATVSADGKWQENRVVPLNSQAAKDIDNALKLYQAYSIKYRIVYLQYLIPQLEAMRLKFSGEELNRLGNVLASNAMSYLLAESQGGIFQPEFEDAKNELEAKGVAVETEEYITPEEDYAALEQPASNPENPPAAILKPLLKNKFFAALFRFTAPFQNIQKVQDVLAANPAPVQTEPSDDRIYIITNIDNPNLAILPYSDAMIKHNQWVVREASRANLYAVLADQSLEEIEKMVGDCMTSAFGQAQYDLPPNIEKTIQSAVGQGAADYLIYEMAKNNSKYAELIGQEIIDNLGKKANGTLQKRCADSCGCKSACLMNEQTLKNFVDDANSDSLPTDDYPNDKECVAVCIKGNIPANFVSSKIGIFLVEDLMQRLPDEIAKDLNSSLKDILSTSTVISSLDKTMGALYNKVLHGALSKSFADNIPDLKKFLNSNIYNYLAKQTSQGFMRKIDGFLNFSISKYLQQRISKEAQKVATGLGNEFENLVANGADALKKLMPNYFPESIMDKEQCNTTELLLQGYLWQETTLPGQETGPDGKCKTYADCKRYCDAHSGDSQDIAKKCRDHFLMGSSMGCKKLTPEVIMKMKANPGDTTPDGGMAMYRTELGGDGAILNIDGENQTVEMLCHKAGYVWSQYWEGSITNEGWQGREMKDWRCGEDQTMLTDLRGLTDVRALSKKFVAGAINFIEEFSVALTETILHTTMAYADVWIEDEVLHPLEGYITQFSGFQDNLKKFLHSSVQNLLPEQISQTLNGNVDGVLKIICDKADPEPTDERERAELASKEPLKKDQIKISLYGEKTWGKIIPVSGITNGELWAACDVSRHLNTTLSKEISSTGKIGAKIVEILNSTVLNLIPWEGVKKYLAMSPSEIIFQETGIGNINELVNGTPVDVLCGKLIGVDDNGSSGVYIGLDGQKDVNGRLPLAAKCDSLKTNRKISYSGYNIDLTFPDFDPNSPNLTANDKAKNADLYRYYCPFIWGACQLPGGGSLPLVGKSVGEIIKSLLVMKCGLTDRDAKDVGCKGACLGQSNSLATQELQRDPDCSDDIKSTCEQCNILLNDSAAYFLIAYVIEKDIGSASNRTPRQRQNEIDTYCWFSVYFPLWKGGGGPIEVVAKSRGILASEITNCDSRARVLLNNVDGMSNDMWLKTVILWRLGEGVKTVKDIFIHIPDGIVKPWRYGDATLLRGRGEGEATNILDKTPSQVLGFGNVVGVCNKIESSYKEKYSSYTFEAIYQQVAKQHPPGLAYSMDSLDRPTIAEALNKLSETLVPDEYKYPYLICQYLRSTPAQIFGLDQKLMYYVRPKEYQILFQLIQNELAPGERPEFLNSLLNYLSNYTPVNALASAAPIARNLSVNPALYDTRLWETGLSITQTINESESTLNGLAKFFGTTVAAQLQAVFAKKAGGEEKKIIDQLCATPSILPAGLCDAKLAKDSSKWADVERALLNSPIDLLVKALDYKIPAPANFEKKACRKPSPIVKRMPGSKGCAAGEYILPKTDPKNKTGDDLCCKKVDSLMDAVGLFWPFLGDPYVDSLFNAAGWTDNVYSFVEGANSVSDGIDKMTVTVVNSVAGAIDKVVLEEPLALAKFIGNKVASLVGLDIGNDLGDNMAGRCWEVIPDKPETACDTTKGQVARLRDGKNECCNMGGALVCTNKCSAIGLDNQCDEKAGEAAREPNSNVCCYANITPNQKDNDECYKCRELKSKGASGGDKCSRKDEEMITRMSDNGQEITLCCKKRTAQETLTGTGLPEGNEQDAAKLNKVCCETITECVSDKFLNHLEVMKDYLIDGLPINASSLLPK